MKTRWRIAGFLILVWLVFVVNPELRLVLIVVDSLGLELVVMLLVIQFRTFLPIIQFALASASSWFCAASFSILRGCLRLVGALLPARASTGISMLLYVMSKNLWCPLSQPSAIARPVN